jgi:hypothetical protein
MSAIEELQKSMAFMRGSKNKGGIYALCRMDAAIKEGLQEKKILPFWEGLAHFNECRLDKALPLFKEALQVSGGKELVTLILDDRRLDEEDLTLLGKLVETDVAKQIRKLRKRIRE